MLETLITIAAMYAVILAAHEYMLKAIHKDASVDPKIHNNVSD